MFKIYQNTLERNTRLGQNVPKWGENVTKYGQNVQKIGGSTGETGQNVCYVGTWFGRNRYFSLF